MKELIKKLLFDVLGKNKLTISYMEEKESIVSLINKIRPYRTDKELIRFGPNGDGGYLIPNDLEGIEACFSPGVGALSGFEEDCMNMGMKSFLADNSVNSPVINNLNLHFIKKHIGIVSNDNYITIDDWVNSSLTNTKSDLLLQMDIEGSEYFTIINMSNDLLNRFRIIVIEFHDLDKFWNKDFFKLVSPVFDKLLQNHTCVHIHPNNVYGIDKRQGVEIPILAEFTFLRNDRICIKKPYEKFPHELDIDNTSNEPVFLPKNWW